MSYTKRLKKHIATDVPVDEHDRNPAAHVIPAPSSIPATVSPHLMTWNHRRTDSGYQEYGLPLFSASFTDCASFPTFKAGTASGTIANGVLSIPASAALSHNAWFVDFKAASGIIEATIESAPTTGAYSKIAAAWILSDLYSLRFEYDHIAHTATIIERYNGNDYAKSAALAHTATFPMRLALEFNSGTFNGRINGKLVVTQNAYMGYDVADDWVNGFISSAANPTFKSFLEANKAGLITSTNAATAFTVSKIRVTTGCAVSWREPYVIRHKDGAPYQRDGKYWLIACDAPLNYQNDIRAMENGIYSFDPTTCETRLVTRIHLNATTPGGTNLASHRICQFSDGQLIYDDDTGEWICVMTTPSHNSLWTSAGSPPGALRRQLYMRTKGDPLAGGVFVVEGPQAILDPAFPPTSGVGPYNACVQWIGDRYWCASSMNSVLCLSWSPDIASGWTMATVVGATGSGEGARWTKVGGDWFILFGQATGFQVYSFNAASATAAFLGLVEPPQLNNAGDYGSPATHPCLLEWLDGDGTTHYTLVAPDGYQRADMSPSDFTYGRRVILESSETTAGRIHPLHLLD